MQRYTRHQLKRDQFVETTAETVHWAVEHRKTLIVAGTVIAVLLLAAIGGWTYLNRRNQQASLEMGKAMRVYQAPLRPAGAPADPNLPSFTSAEERAKASREEFRRIAGEFRFTRQSEFARYMVGVTSVQAGDLPTAEQELKQVADTRNKDLSALAKFALAALYRSQQKQDEAIKLYKELADGGAHTVPKATAQLELAATYEAKQPAEALKVYEQIRKDDGESLAAQIASAKIQQLSGAAPAQQQ